MPSLWFIIPAHGRTGLARICLAQMRATCDELTAHGVEASAVVIADDGNLDIARDLGFAWVRRDNQAVGRKFNDGIQLACDPRYNQRPVTHIVPCGNDDFVDWRLFIDLPNNQTMVGFKYCSFVREDGRELTSRRLEFDGGCGVRIYPREMLKAVGYRPCDEDIKRGCDTSILVNVRRSGALGRIENRGLEPHQIVDWKTDGHQLNSYANVAGRHYSKDAVDPFEALQGHYPDEALDAIRDHYRQMTLVAA